MNNEKYLSAVCGQFLRSPELSREEDSQEERLGGGKGPVAVHKLRSRDVSASDAERYNLPSKERKDETFRPDTCKTIADTVGESANGGVIQWQPRHRDFVVPRQCGHAGCRSPIFVRGRFDFLVLNRAGHVCEQRRRRFKTLGTV